MVTALVLSQARGRREAVFYGIAGGTHDHRGRIKSLNHCILDAVKNPRN